MWRHRVNATEKKIQSAFTIDFSTMTTDGNLQICNKIWNKNDTLYRKLCTSLLSRFSSYICKLLQYSGRNTFWWQISVRLVFLHTLFCLATCWQAVLWSLGNVIPVASLVLRAECVPRSQTCYVEGKTRVVLHVSLTWCNSCQHNELLTVRTLHTKMGN